MSVGQNPLTTVGVILVVMAVVTVIEIAIPLHARGRWNRDHLAPNLTLTFLTFGTNACFNVALVMVLARFQTNGIGFLPRLGISPWMTLLVALLWLDFSFYVAHLAMHKAPGFWRFHQVHHADPAVDVTTTVRQHPGEGVIRYAFLAAFALPLGAGPGPFALYRLTSVLSGLLEHANLRLPPRLDDLLSLVVTWPNTHKIHHSRNPRYTDTNYGNLFSWWDRLFGTFTPARHGAAVACGLDGLDDPTTQTTAGLLRLPFRPPADAPTGAAPTFSPERC